MSPKEKTLDCFAAPARQTVMRTHHALTRLHPKPFVPPGSAEKLRPYHFIREKSARMSLRSVFVPQKERLRAYLPIFIMVTHCIARSYLGPSRWQH